TGTRSTAFERFPPAPDRREFSSDEPTFRTACGVQEASRGDPNMKRRNLIQSRNRRRSIFLSALLMLVALPLTARAMWERCRWEFKECASTLGDVNTPTRIIEMGWQCDEDVPIALGNGWVVRASGPPIHRATVPDRAPRRGRRGDPVTPDGEFV